jgi:hypothetical protein
LSGTADHPVFSYPGFAPLGAIDSQTPLSKLTLKELFVWQYRKLLSSMVSATDSWEVEDIILANLAATKGDAVRKDFMLQCGSFIADRQFRKAMKFITKMATALITTTAIWSAYRARNIVGQLTTRRSGCGSIWMKSVPLLLRGISPKKAANGIASTEESAWKRDRWWNALVFSAEQPSKQRTNTPSSAPTTAASSTITETNSASRSASVQSAEQSLKRKSDQANTAEKLAASPAKANCCGQESERLPVYNLTVAKSHLYYANGILVHNCDAASQALNWMLFAHGHIALPDPVNTRDRNLLMREQELFLNPGIYDVYGAEDTLY